MTNSICNWKRLIVALLFTGMLVPRMTLAIRREPAVEAKDHPELVLITAKQLKRKTVRRYSGALVAPNVVLTNARCVRGYQVWEVSAPYAKGGAVQAVSRVGRVHPDYDPRYSGENALALILLDQDIDIGRTFPALYQGNLLRLGASVVVTGRSDNGKVSRDRLFQSAVVRLVDYDEDSNVYGGTPNVVQWGDMGGPVYNTEKEPKIVAVTTGFVDSEMGNVQPTPTDLFSPITRKNKAWVEGVIQEARQGKKGK